MALAAIGVTAAISSGDGRAVLTLPSPCFAPIVFVTSGTGNWFAVTGR